MGDDHGTEVYTWGQGIIGQLGHGDEKTQKQPRLIVSFLGINVKAISCGNQHTGVLLESGEVYTFGRGNFGQLGHGALGTNNIPSPQIVEGLSGKHVISIALGWHHTMALLDNGQVYSWGSGEYGRLGHGDEQRQPAPKLIDALAGKTVKKIQCGGFHSAAITDRGALYTWGGGYFGQLGQGDTTDKKVPRQIKALRDKTVVAVSCGTHHTLSVTENSEVFAWGAGEQGKLGVGDDEKHTSPVLVEALQGKGITAVACGGFHSLALSDSGVVYAWGGGDKGQLGLGDENPRSIPEVVTALSGKSMVAISGGMHTSLALANNGDVYSWGSGEYGRLGHNDEGMYPSPQIITALQGKGISAISCGGFHTAALASSAVDGSGLPVYAPRDRKAGQSEEDTFLATGQRPGTVGTVDSDFQSAGGSRPATRSSFATKKSYEGDEDDDEEDYKLKEQLKETQRENAELRRELELVNDRHRQETQRLEVRVQQSQEDRNHLKKQLERMQEKQQANENIKSKLQTMHEENAELKKKAERTRGDLKQRTVDVHMLQVRVAQLCGSELDGLTVSQLEELERMQTEAIRRVGVAKYSRLKSEFKEKEDKMRDDVERMKADFDDKMDKMSGEVQKIQEEKVHLMGLEQRLRQEFQTQVQAEQMSNEELRIRLETLQDGFVQLRSILRKEKQGKVEVERHPMEDM